jgi:hypothetical protein
MESCFRISQGCLNLLATCPPKFQKVYLEKLVSPPSPEQEQKTQWGSLFHLFMQQINLGLPLDSLLIENQELRNSVQALMAETSKIWQSKNPISREAEHYRSINYQGYLLTVIFDLLVCYKEKAIIFDWKTYLQPENSQKLAKNWQTRLYLYVLAETSNYQPEDISMTYWFVKLPQKPISLTFNYNSEKHQQTEKDLSNLLQKLNKYLDEYLNQNKPFPHVNNCANNCPYYNQFLNLDNNQLNYTNINSLISIDDIEEINIE